MARINGRHEPCLEYHDRLLGRASIAQRLAAQTCKAALDRRVFHDLEAATGERYHGIEVQRCGLRDGRIQKSKRGQFAMADASPILNEAKRRVG